MFKLPDLLKIIILFVLCENSFGQAVEQDAVNSSKEDEQLNFTGLASKYGFPAEEFKVVTEDGYILTIFHIPGHLGPIFLQHGIIDSGDAFIIRGNLSMAITLAKAGYDVWVGNIRGNSYSREHVTLNPDTDKDFWNYTMHELGYYDLPAMIDFVLDKTGKSKLIAIGHSQGNAIFYVLGSTRPEYNDKVKVLIALAPVAYLHHVRFPASLLVKLAPAINLFLYETGQEELYRNHSAKKGLTEALCSYFPLRYVCGVDVIQFYAGVDDSEVERPFFDVAISHYPKATSRMNALHLSQISKSKEFKQFDYGTTENLKRYGSKNAPKYNLGDVTMRVELLVGRNDRLSTVEDSKLLWKRLPNATYTLLDRKKLNHADFVWGKHAYKYLFPYIFNILHHY